MLVAVGLAGNAVLRYNASMRISLVVFIVVAACSGRAPAPIKVTPAERAPTGLPSLSTSELMEKAVPGAEVRTATATLPAPSGVHGRVVERIDAPPYSYLRLATATGEAWAAVPQNELAKGAEATIDQPMLMHDFTSKTLKRTFPEVYFGTLVGQKDLTHSTPAATNPTPAPEPKAAQKPEQPEKLEKIAKAPGKDARTIAEIHAQKDALHDRTVVVRGQVTKYNGGILGKNWLHLRDGSGSAAKKDDDLTITSKDAANVGDVLVVTGTVRIGKDFGSGYAYPVMIEEATLGK